MALVMTVVSPSPASAAAGDLDPTFGGNGKVTTRFAAADPFASASANDVALQSDGKIVAAGGVCSDFVCPFALARYDAAGNLDPTFGGDGRVATRFAGVASANAVAVQADGKIVAAGLLNSVRIALARYNPDGSLDATFGSGGKVMTEFAEGRRNAVGNAVVIQADGKIVAAGSLSGTRGGFLLVRYQTDGALDPTFGGDGSVLTRFRGGEAAANAIVLQADGKIVAAGGALSRFALARYKTDGSLDATFGGDGKVTTRFADALFAGANAVASQTDGKIVAAGFWQVAGTVRWTLARYNTDGTLDPTFGGNGRVTTKFAAGSASAQGVAVHAEGKIVAAGVTHTSRGDRFALARYGSDATLDATFGGDGKVTTGFAAGDARADGIAIQTDGKIVAAGSAPDQDWGVFALARYFAS